MSRCRSCGKDPDAAPMGRPSKLTPELAKALIDQLRLGAYFERACAAVGLDESLGYKWLDRGKRARRGVYADFFQSIQKEIALVENMAAGQVLTRVDNWQALMTFLERRHARRWSARVNVNVREELDAVLDKLERRMGTDGRFTFDEILATIAVRGESQDEVTVTPRQLPAARVVVRDPDDASDPEAE